MVKRPERIVTRHIEQRVGRLEAHGREYRARKPLPAAGFVGLGETAYGKQQDSVRECRDDLARR